VMTAVRWKWWNGAGPDHVPTVEQLKTMALGLLGNVCEHPDAWFVSSGGFVARRIDGELLLSFEVARATSREDEF
jgi:hypothetical protein